MEDETKYLQVENLILRYENPKVAEELWQQCQDEKTQCELTKTPETAQYYAEHAKPVQMRVRLLVEMINKASGMQSL